MFEKEFIEAFEKNDLQYQQDHVNDIYWYDISRYTILSEAFIDRFQDKVKWSYISKYQNLSEQFVEKYQDKLNWINISYYQKLSWKFISHFFGKLDLFYLFHNDDISQDIKDKLKKLQIFK